MRRKEGTKQIRIRKSTHKKLLKQVLQTNVSIVGFVSDAVEEKMTNVEEKTIKRGL